MTTYSGMMMSLSKAFSCDLCTTENGDVVSSDLEALPFAVSLAKCSFSTENSLSSVMLYTILATRLQLSRLLHVLQLKWRVVKNDRDVPSSEHFYRWHRSNTANDFGDRSTFSFHSPAESLWTFLGMLTVQKTKSQSFERSLKTVKGQGS